MEENVIHINGGTTINVDVSLEKHNICEKDYIWNPALCSCESRKYLASIIDDSVFTCDEIIESYGKDKKTIPTNFNEKCSL